MIEAPVMLVDIPRGSRVGEVDLSRAKVAYYPHDDLPEEIRNKHLAPREILLLNGPDGAYMARTVYFAFLERERLVAGIPERKALGDFYKLTEEQAAKIRRE